MDIFDSMQLMLCLMILGGGSFFTFYLKGFFFLHPRRTLREMFYRKDKSGISPLRALSASLSGTLGVGNIVGVAVAMIIGGAGAVFWIWISALFSMVLKYCEITLGVKYRKKSADGYEGGPMMYMENGIGGSFGKACGTAFAFAAVISSFAMGNIVQMSAASDSANIIFGADKAIFGAVCALMIGLTIFGGFERISRVTSILLPVMSAAYVLLSLAVMIRNAAILPSLLKMIVAEAFRFDSALGGINGFLLSKNVSEGIAKGTFSHESGSGTAPMAHANAQTDTPARQGALGLFEVFVDTMIICSLTAFVILIAWEKGTESENGMELVLLAFGREVGTWSQYIIGFSIEAFAFSTIICWAFYGKLCLSYITRSRRAQICYITLYLLLIVFGTFLSQTAVWRTADIGVAVMTALNLPSLFILRREIKSETEILF